MAKIIHFIEAKRKAATTDLEKDFFKLLSNSVHGKSTESIRKRVNVQIFSNSNKLRKAIAKVTCLNFNKINEDMAMVRFEPKKIIQNKPLYTGFMVLGLSKVLQYDFHYNNIQSQVNTA